MPCFVVMYTLLNICMASALTGNVHNEEPEKALLAGPCAALLEVNKARTSLDVVFVTIVCTERFLEEVEIQ
jgi:hypothetical protein